MWLGTWCAGTAQIVTFQYIISQAILLCLLLQQTTGSDLLVGLILSLHQLWPSNGQERRSL
jgi:hypothetical protein